MAREQVNGERPIDTLYAGSRIASLPSSKQDGCRGCNRAIFRAASRASKAAEYLLAFGKDRK